MKSFSLVFQHYAPLTKHFRCSFTIELPMRTLIITLAAGLAAAVLLGNTALAQTPTIALSEWKNISPDSVQGAENILVTASNKLLVTTRTSPSVFEIRQTTPNLWQSLSQGLPTYIIIPPKPGPQPILYERVFTPLVTAHGIYGFAGRTIVFLGNTASEWITRGSYTGPTAFRPLGTFQNVLCAGSSTSLQYSGRISISLDSGKTWVNKMEGIPESSVDVQSFAAVDSGIIAGTSLGIFTSKNFAAPWVRKYSSSQNQWQVLKVSDDLVYAQNYQTKELLLSQDRGENWTPTRLNGASADTIYAITTKEQAILLASNKGVFLSSDSGRSWRNASLGLPSDAPVHSLGVLGSAAYAVSGGKIYQASIQAPSSVQEQDTRQEIFSILPNPTRERLSIEFSEIPTLPVVISIVNVFGQTIYQQECTAGKYITLDIHNAATGVYFCNVTVGTTRYTQKFVVQQ